MSKIFNRQLITILILFLVISAGLFFAVAKPRFFTFKERYKSLSENQTKLAALIARKESLIKLKKDEKRIEEALKKAQGILPKAMETSDFLVQLEAASAETGNTLKSITMTEAPKKETAKKEEEELKEGKEEAKPTTAPYQTITFSITLSGNFKQLLDFLSLSENLSRFTFFPSATLTGAVNNLIETKLEGEIYYKEVK